MVSRNDDNSEAMVYITTWEKVVTNILPIAVVIIAGFVGYMFNRMDKLEQTQADMATSLAVIKNNQLTRTDLNELKTDIIDDLDKSIQIAVLKATYSSPMEKGKDGGKKE